MRLRGLRQFSEANVVLLQRSDSLLLETRSRWQIPNELRPERHPAALQAAIELVRQIVPDAILRSITATYNCIGMVVASRRIGGRRERDRSDGSD